MAGRVFSLTVCLELVAWGFIKRDSEAREQGCCGIKQQLTLHCCLIGRYAIHPLATPNKDNYKLIKGLLWYWNERIDKWWECVQHLFGVAQINPLCLVRLVWRPLFKQLHHVGFDMLPCKLWTAWTALIVAHTQTRPIDQLYDARYNLIVNLKTVLVKEVLSREFSNYARWLMMLQCFFIILSYLSSVWKHSW